jgi:hypothetical protein
LIDAGAQCHQSVEPNNAGRQQQRDGQHQARADQVGGHHQALAVEPVDEDPGHQADQQAGR